MEDEVNVLMVLSLKSSMPIRCSPDISETKIKTPGILADGEANSASISGDSSTLDTFTTAVGSGELVGEIACCPQAKRNKVDTLISETMREDLISAICHHLTVLYVSNT